jgi:hypothetical protein
MITKSIRVTLERAEVQRICNALNEEASRFKELAKDPRFGAVSHATFLSVADLNTDLTNKLLDAVAKSVQ